MIKLQVIGHLGKDCVTKDVNGKTVMNFTLAHSERYKDAQGNMQERTTWVDCAYWSDRTAVSNYLKKGQLVYVEGSPEVRSYQKNDGTPGASLTLRVQSVQLLGAAKTELNPLQEEHAGGVDVSGRGNFSGATSSGVAVGSDSKALSDDTPF
jgi:single-strand DNA-binding protein